MKSTLCLAAAVSALLVCMSAAHAQSNDRYVVIDNMNAVTGQAEVDGRVAIPIEDTAQFADALGNIRVQCKKGTHGDSTTCSNIGTGGSALPIAPVVTLTAPTSPVTANGAKISWGSTGADVCYGLSAQGSTGAPVVTGWTKEWTKAGGNGFALDSLLAGMDAGTSATYDFVLRCYSTPTGTIGQTKIVAYTDKTATVTLNKSAGGVGQPPAGDWCEQYKQEMPGPERAHLEAYLAENRGFTAITDTFSNFTKVTLGQGQNLASQKWVAPAVGVPGLPGLKPQVSQYHALSFSLPTAAEGKGKFRLKFQYATGNAGMKDTNVIATISPCKGDFRPQAVGSEAYLTPFCRTQSGEHTDTIKGSTDSSEAAFRCVIPANATMYINIAVRNMYDLGVTGQNNESYSCGVGPYCGRGAWAKDD